MAVHSELVPIIAASLCYFLLPEILLKAKRDSGQVRMTDLDVINQNRNSQPGRPLELMN